MHEDCKFTVKLQSYSQHLFILIIIFIQGVVESESFQDPDTSEAEISQEREIPELIYSEEDSPEL